LERCRELIPLHDLEAQVKGWEVSLELVQEGLPSILGGQSRRGVIHEAQDSIPRSPNLKGALLESSGYRVILLLGGSLHGRMKPATRQRPSSNGFNQEPRPAFLWSVVLWHLCMA
jgi:hypothetical protein